MIVTSGRNMLVNIEVDNIDAWCNHEDHEGFSVISH